MKILITGGAGFIGSNLVDFFLSNGHKVNCIDDYSTGYEYNIKHHFNNPNFKFFHGDIRDLKSCIDAAENCDYILHHAALGSVPRSIENPIETNAVNIDGFLNVLIAARNHKVKRFIYAASSSTYGDSKKLPKVEEEIGKPLSPYAITKLVNELYADVFAKSYKMQCIGLRYFNVFGKRQDPNGAYAAVIPLWAKKLINYEQPIINGDGSYSRDFTYIENVIQANDKALFVDFEQFKKRQREYFNLDLDRHKFLYQNNDILNNDDLNHLLANTSDSFSEVFNIAYGGNTTLINLYNSLKLNLSKYDQKIADIEPIFGEFRIGDIPHSQASIIKAQTILRYQPQFDAIKGFELAAEWYYNYFKNKNDF